MDHPKTVIGSFPRKQIPVEDGIKLAVDLQLKHGIDIISDGEQRAEMIGYFSVFPGLGRKRHGPYIQSKVLPMEDPKTFVKLGDLEFVRSYLRSIGRDGTRVKVTVTGPITLGFSCAVNGVEYYASVKDQRLYSDFALALNPLIREIAKTGCYIQIDEPSLSTRVMATKEAVRIVNQALDGLPGSIRDGERLALHTCGPLTEDLFRDFMALEVPILSLAFSGSDAGRNLDIVSRNLLQDHGKKLGVGCISVQVMRREDLDSQETIISRIDYLLKKVGPERIFCFHPDCGLGSTKEEFADLILERMVFSLGMALPTKQ